MSYLQQEFDSPLLGCSLCHRAIESGELIYEEQTGWVKKRTGGGTNALTDARKTGRVACARCIEKLRRHIHPEQLRIS